MAQIAFGVLVLWAGIGMLLIMLSVLTNLAEWVSTLIKVWAILSVTAVVIACLVIGLYFILAPTLPNR